MRPGSSRASWAGPGVFARGAAPLEAADVRRVESAGNSRSGPSQSARRSRSARRVAEHSTRLVRFKRCDRPSGGLVSSDWGAYSRPESEAVCGTTRTATVREDGISAALWDTFRREGPSPPSGLRRRRGHPGSPGRRWFDHRFCGGPPHAWARNRPSGITVEADDRDHPIGPAGVIPELWPFGCVLVPQSGAFVTFGHRRPGSEGLAPASTVTFGWATMFRYQAGWVGAPLSCRR
jgi:hypothetical protein